MSTAQPGPVITAESDPNHLLGRPGGYTSAATFADARVPEDSRNPGDPTAVENGGKVETFSEDEAQQSMDYIRGIQQQAGPIAGTEYDYLAGASLVRVSGGLTPQQASEYEAALKK